MRNKKDAGHRAQDAGVNLKLLFAKGMCKKKFPLLLKEGKLLLFVPATKLFLS